MCDARTNTIGWWPPIGANRSVGATVLLTRHAKVIGIADEQRVANAFVRFVITTGADAAEMILAFFLAPSGHANVGRRARTRARANVGLARSTGERVADGTLRAFTRRPSRRHYALGAVAANILFARYVIKTKRYRHACWLFVVRGTYVIRIRRIWTRRNRRYIGTGRRVYRIRSTRFQRTTVGRTGSRTRLSRTTAERRIRRPSNTRPPALLCPNLNR